MKKYYVCGFLFIDDSVLLVQKIKGPACVVGLWNGVGGSIEKGETPLEAMTREFNEETGIGFWEWRHFCHLVGGGAEVHFFTMKAEDSAPVRSHNDIGEKLEWMRLTHPFWPVVPNLQWLLPLALDENTFATVNDSSF